MVPEHLVATSQAEEVGDRDSRQADPLCPAFLNPQGIVGIREQFLHAAIEGDAQSLCRLLEAYSLLLPSDSVRQCRKTLAPLVEACVCGLPRDLKMVTPVLAMIAMLHDSAAQAVENLLSDLDERGQIRNASFLLYAYCALDQVEEMRRNLDAPEAALKLDLPALVLKNIAQTLDDQDEDLPSEERQRQIINLRGPTSKETPFSKFRLMASGIPEFRLEIMDRAAHDLVLLTKSLNSEDIARRAVLIDIASHSEGRLAEVLTSVFSQYSRPVGALIATFVHDLHQTIREKTAIEVDCDGGDIVLRSKRRSSQDDGILYPLVRDHLLALVPTDSPERLSEWFAFCAQWPAAHQMPFSVMPGEGNSLQRLRSVREVAALGKFNADVVVVCGALDEVKSHFSLDNAEVQCEALELLGELLSRSQRTFFECLIVFAELLATGRCREELFQSYGEALEKRFENGIMSRRGIREVQNILLVHLGAPAHEQFREVVVQLLRDTAKVLEHKLPTGRKRNFGNTERFLRTSIFPEYQECAGLYEAL